MMIVQKPTLTLPQAVRLALANLTNFNGRSRRSEYWWFMLPYYIITQLISLVLMFALSTVAVTIVQNLLVFFMFAVSVRRLHDCGHSAWWFIIYWVLSFIGGTWLVMSAGYTSLLANSTPEAVVTLFTSPAFLVSSLGSVLGLVIFVFALMDGAKGDNQYGPSPKYSSVDDEATQASTL